MRKTIHTFAVTLILLAGCSSGPINQPAPPANHAANNNPLPMTFGPMPQHIALLLPISGKLAPQATAIRNGFFAAFYQNNQHNPVPLIKVYDTSHRDITAVYHQAIAEGAQFVVGPLIKNDLTALVNARALSVPTLALNTLDGNQTRINHLYQFGLSPIDEAIQAAVKIKHDGHHRVIVITMASNFGKRITNAFEQQWRKQGRAENDTIVAKLSFENMQDLNNGIPKVLNIDEARHRAQFLQTVVREKIRYEPYRRHDFDAIFLAASANQARQVLPLLRFYYAGNIPVYATSSVYSGKPGTSVDYDLNGVIFDDMPWVVTTPAQLPNNLIAIQQNIRTLWPNSYTNLARLYALGVDAYHVIPNIDKLSSSSQLSVSGATGQLYLLPNQHVYRQLEWAKMINGTPAVQSP